MQTLQNYKPMDAESIESCISVILFENRCGGILFKGGAHLQKSTLNEIRTTSNHFRLFDYPSIPILSGIGQSCAELCFWPIGPKICLG